MKAGNLLHDFWFCFDNQWYVSAFWPMQKAIQAWMEMSTWLSLEVFSSLWEYHMLFLWALACHKRVCSRFSKVRLQIKLPWQQADEECVFVAQVQLWVTRCLVVYCGLSFCQCLCGMLAKINLFHELVKIIESCHKRLITVSSSKSASTIFFRVWGIAVRKNWLILSTVCS